MKDWTYIAAFDRDDLPLLYQLSRDIRKTHNTVMIENYLTKCQQKVDDHKPVLQIGNKKIEFLDVIKSDDLATNPGLQQYIRIVLGTSAVRFRYIGYGSGTTAAVTSDTILVTELGRADTLALGGWNEAEGMKLFYGGIVGESASATAIKEIGVFNASSGGIMFNRNVFANNTLTRVANTAVFILSSVIQMVPTV